MKKKCFKALALLLTTVLFFNLVFFNHAQKVHAALPPVVIWVLSAVGGYALNEFVLEPINEKLGWSDSDIKTDSEGNVIISPEQMEEIKAAAEDVVFAENGCYLYKSTATKTYRQYVADCNYAESDSWYDGNPIPLVSDYTPYPTWIKDHTSYWDERFIIEKPYYYVAGVNQTSIQTFDNSGNLVSGISYYGYDGSWHKQEAYTSAVGGTGSYYGQDLVVFNNEESLKKYLGLPDEEKPFLMPVINDDGTVSNDNKIPAYDPGTGTVIEIEFTYDDSMDLVFTPEGYLYLNYTDIDNDGVPDDHDPEVDGSDETVGTQIMRAGMITYTGTGSYGSGNPNSITFDHVPIHVWIHCDDDDGYTIDADFSASDTSFTRVSSKGTSSAIRQNSAFWSEDGLTVSWYSTHNASAQCNANNITYTVTYTYYDYVEMGSNPSGGGTVDLTDTNNYLDGINNTLDEILKWVKKIYNQVVLGNIIEGADLLNDLFQQELDDLSALGEIAQTKFPFSLAFDILAILTILEAPPQAPVFEIPFRADFGGATGISVDEVFVLDFTMFEDATEVLRWWMSILWVFTLVWITPKFLDVGGDLTGGGKK